MGAGCGRSAAMRRSRCSGGHAGWTDGRRLHTLDYWRARWRLFLVAFILFWTYLWGCCTFCLWAF